MKTFATAFALLLSITISFTSCKKNQEGDVNNPIVGSWTELDITSASRSISFNKDNTFNLYIGDNHGVGTLINGTYQVDGNRLKTYAVEKREQKNGKTVEIKPYSGEVYDAATFSISSDIMMLTYNTFPADAPVSTTAKYQKNLIID
jgi:uncharacterized protein (TIGR03066 family)